MQVTVQVLVEYRVQDPQSIVQLPLGQLWTPNFTQILEVGPPQCFSMIQVRETNGKGKRGKKRKGKGKGKAALDTQIYLNIRIWPSSMLFFDSGKGKGI